MATTLPTLFSFVVVLVISTVIIYVITKFFGEKEGIVTALIAALAGSAIYTIVYYFVGGLLAAFIAGIAWLLALQFLYGIGWIRSLIIAAIIWIMATIVGWVLPTVTGPV